MMEITIPGPGSAMAFAVSIAIYSSAFASEISDLFRGILIIMAVIFSYVTYQIEKLHNDKNNNNDLSTTIRDEIKQIGEVKLTQKDNIVIATYIAAISMGIGFFGSLFANYAYDDLYTKIPFNVGYYGSFFIFIGFIFAIFHLGHKIRYSKTKKKVDESEQSDS